MSCILSAIKDMQANEVRIRELTILAEQLKEEHYSEYEMIQEMIEKLTRRWVSLNQMAESRKEQLDSATEIQKFHRLALVPWYCEESCKLDLYPITSAP